MPLSLKDKVIIWELTTLQHNTTVQIMEASKPKAEEEGQKGYISWK